MHLTPAQVRCVAFSKPPIGKRGCHEDEVDAFLNVVEVELARLLEEYTDLRNQLQQCDQQPGPAAIDTAAAPLELVSPPMRQPLSAGEDDYHHHHAARVLNLAQQTADRVTSQARAEADALLSQARANAERLLREAQSTAEGLVSEAATRAKTVLHDAHTRAETVERQSRTQVDKVASQQQEELRQHTVIITALDADKAALENRIEHLRVFEDDYRVRLMRFLQAQLQHLRAQQPTGSVDTISTEQAPVAVGSDAHPQTSPPWFSSEKRRWTPAVSA